MPTENIVFVNMVILSLRTWAYLSWYYSSILWIHMFSYSVSLLLFISFGLYVFERLYPSWEHAHRSEVLRLIPHPNWMNNRKMNPKSFSSSSSITSADGGDSPRSLGQFWICSEENEGIRAEANDHWKMVWATLHKGIPKLWIAMRYKDRKGG